jgi:hypothetical protein
VLTAENVPTSTRGAGEYLWLTRERWGGELADTVDVWVYPPEAHLQADGDVLWLAPMDVVNRRATYLVELSLAEAPAVPQSAEECVRVRRARG